MKFKFKGWIVIALALILLLGACSSQDDAASTDNESSTEQSTTNETEATEESKEPVELSFWIFGAPGYENLADEYMKLNPHVTIKTQKFESAAIRDAIFTAISSGTGAPDAVMMDTIIIEKYKDAEDRFYNLYDLGAKDLESKYLGWKWGYSASNDGDFLFGLPTDIGPMALYYRPDLFAEAGLPTDPAEVTKLLSNWDQFATVAKQYTEKTGKAFVDSTTSLYNTIRGQGDALYYDKDGNFIAEQNAQIKKAFEYTAKGIKEGWVSKLPTFSAEWSAGIANGDFAVLPGAAWMQGFMVNNAPDGAGKWSATDMPEGPANWGGSALLMPKEGKHPEETFAFISWMLAPEQQLKSFQSNGLFPSAVELYELPEFKDYNNPYFGDLRIAETFIKAAKGVKPAIFGKLFYETNTEIMNPLNAIVADPKLDTQAQWDAAMKAAKDLIERNQ
jgi:cellobiose transport system substrate-binding protein